VRRFFEPSVVPGVNVVGYFSSESGVGRAARAVVAGLDAAGIPVHPVHPPDTPPSRQGVRYATIDAARAGFPVNLMCVTALETPSVVAAIGPEFFARRHTIGLWWWEVEAFPPEMHPAFAHVDEVWCGSRHIADAIGSVAGGVPVHEIRVPVPPLRVRRRSRAALGLPQGFVFLTAFGYYSSIVRKNPVGAIDAFRRAFPEPGTGVSLVIKAIDHEAHPAEHAELLEAAARHPDIHVLAGYVDEDEMGALLAASDAVVSLHRAEGFGFLPAEAMTLGIPVVATGYSGSLAYMTPENAFLVAYQLRAIGPEGAPYPAGGRWAEPDLADAAVQLRRVVEDRAEARRRADRARADMVERFSPAGAGVTMRDALAGTGPFAPAARRARLRAAALRASRRRMALRA
jgi:glycosyltransferase involved in cell wall biosynthesis